MIKSVYFVENFVDSLEFGIHTALASVLLQTARQCQDFYIGFLGRNQQVIDDLLDYREHRLLMSDMSVDNFLQMCDNKGKQKGMEDTFLQPITNADMEIIDIAIKEGRITLVEIYDNFQLNVNKNIMQYVL